MPCHKNKQTKTKYKLTQDHVTLSCVYKFIQYAKLTHQHGAICNNDKIPLAC